MATDYKALAERSAKIANIPADWIYRQWAHETGNFTSALCLEYNNFGGITTANPTDEELKIKQPDGKLWYKVFDSPEAFADYFGKYINRYDEYGVHEATDIRGYVEALSKGGYFGDSVDNYVAGMTGEAVSSVAGTIAKADLRTIMNFASFTQSLAFKNIMENSFTRSMQDTLHSYLSSFMEKFYHNLYYVPTLPDNRAILVKPECLFIEPPACNVIYPTLKSDLSFSRDPKGEPTRIVSISNPVANIFGDKGANTLTQLITMAFMDYKKDEVTKKYTTETDVTSLNAMSLAYGETDKKKHPQYNMTLYEKDNGIRILTECKGEDLYLFLLANGNDGKKQKGYMVPDSANKKDIGLVLEVLAKYALLRARYEPRVGSCTTVPNPYIVPGFPMLSVEGSADSSLNIYAYVESVTHSITESAWSTSIGFNSTHIYNEPRPPIFPIAEAEYTNSIDKTYTDMLGANMTKVDATTGPADCRKAYVESDGTTDAMLRRIWRPLTTMEQHLKEICDGATVVEEPKYTWFKNADGKTFFNESVQAKIKAYTSDILDGVAFTELDVR